VTPLRTPNARDFARLLFLSAIWGSSFICIEIALADFAPLAIASWRVILASIIVLLLCWVKGYRLPIDKRTFGILAVIGLLNSAVPFYLIGWGQQSVDSATTALLLSTSPFAALLLNHFLTSDDSISANRLLGCVVGFFGVALLFIQEIVLEGNGIFGMLAIMLATICYCLSALLIRKLGSLPSLVVVGGSLLVAMLMLLPMLLWFHPPWKQVYSTGSLSAVLFLSIGPTAIAYVLRTQIVQANGAVFMSTVGYLIPLFAVVWAWLFLSQTPEFLALVAMFLVFIGIYLGQRKPNLSN